MLQWCFVLFWDWQIEFFKIHRIIQVQMNKHSYIGNRQTFWLKIKQAFFICNNNFATHSHQIDLLQKFKMEPTIVWLLINIIIVLEQMFTRLDLPDRCFPPNRRQLYRREQTVD